MIYRLFLGIMVLVNRNHVLKGNRAMVCFMEDSTHS